MIYLTSGFKISMHKAGTDLTSHGTGSPTVHVPTLHVTVCNTSDLR